jgi:hypothetical protein
MPFSRSNYLHTTVTFGQINRLSIDESYLVAFLIFQRSVDTVTDSSHCINDEESHLAAGRRTNVYTGDAAVETLTARPAPTLTDKTRFNS